MKRYTIIMAAVIGSLLTMAVLGIANYFTCFAYNLPHRAVAIEVAPQDIVIEVHPEVYLVPVGFNWTTITARLSRP